MTRKTTRQYQLRDAVVAQQIHSNKGEEMIWAKLNPMKMALAEGLPGMSEKELLQAVMGKRRQAGEVEYCIEMEY